MSSLDVTYLIDDDRIFTHLLSKQMQITNFSDTVKIFHDGDEALEYIRPIANQPDILPSVILLDINMPILDGWQFLDEFIKFDLKKRITIYIVSSSIDDADRRKAASYSAVSNFYVKPITKEHLIDMIKELQD